MNNKQRGFLISTAEDFYYAHVHDTYTIASSIIMTAERRGIEITDIDVRNIIADAAVNYAKGKHTKGGLLGWTGI
jgi:hypothetical protein